MPLYSISYYTMDPNTHCNNFYITEMKLKNPYPTSQELEKAMEYLKDHSIKYGDLVIFKKNAGYRNEGIAIYDGKNLVQLYFDIDDYGSVPPQFKVLQENEYGIDIGLYHWHNIKGKGKWKGICHNYIVWYDPSIHKNQLIENLCYDKKLFGAYALYSHLLDEKGEKIYIVVLYQEMAKKNDYIDQDTYTLNNIAIEKFKKIAIEKFNEKDLPFECYPDDYDYYKKNNKDKKILYLVDFD